MLHTLLNADFLKKVSDHVLTFSTAIVLATWISAITGAALTFIIRSDHGFPRTLKGFLGFCFPSVILRHRSCRLDLGYTVASYVVHPLVVAPVLVGNIVLAKLTYDGLTRSFGAHAQRPESLWLWGAILLAVVVIADLANFLAHYAEHKLPALWELHKVHHSTLFLIPISNRRIHPFQEIIDAGLIILSVGAFLGATSYIFHLPIQDNAVVGVDAYFLANLLSFYHLRHSHIPMSYGWLENLFMSPAQHQIHHSVERQHWDRNFGLLLSCWDKMAGTFVRSGARDFRLGLPPDEQRSYTNVVRLYLFPLLAITRMAAAPALRRLRGVTAADPLRPLIRNDTIH